MVDLKEIKQIYLYNNAISFRNGIEGLSNLILAQFDEKEVNGCLFVFFGRTKKQIKAIEFNDDGIWLYQKKLYDNNFIFPNIDEKGRTIIDKRQLKIILKSLEIASKKVKKSSEKACKSAENGV